MTGPGFGSPFDGFPINPGDWAAMLAADTTLEALLEAVAAAGLELGDECPLCPLCNALPVRISHTQGGCPNDDCRVFIWNPRNTLDTNLNLLATTPPIDLPRLDFDKHHPGLDPATPKETPCPAPTETPESSPPA